MNYEPPAKTSHILHLILTLLTIPLGGVWVFMWGLCIINTCVENARIDARNKRKEEEYFRRMCR